MKNQIIGVYKYLNEAEIKHSNIGFKYLIEAISLMLEDRYKNEKIGSIYETVAKKYATSSICVERAIRYTIGERKVSNKEFIIRASYDILYRNEIIPRSPNLNDHHIKNNSDHISVS